MQIKSCPIKKRTTYNVTKCYIICAKDPDIFLIYGCIYENIHADVILEDAREKMIEGS